MMETLENRTLMSGDVLVKIKNDRATLTGDGLGNSIVLTAGGIDNDHFVVTGIDGTTVNGKSQFSIVTYPGNPFSSMYIKMGGGDDHVNIAEFGDAEPISIDLGAGNDRLDIQHPQSDFTAMDIERRR